MKDNILGIILLALLIVGSSDVMAQTAKEAAMERDMSVAYFCSEMYKHYGASSNFYPKELFEIGVAMRKATDTAAEIAGLVGDSMIIHSQAAMKFVEMRDNLPPTIPYQLDTTCTYMAGILGVL